MMNSGVHIITSTQFLVIRIVGAFPHFCIIKLNLDGVILREALQNTLHENLPIHINDGFISMTHAILYDRVLCKKTILASK